MKVITFCLVKAWWTISTRTLRVWSVTGMPSVDWSQALNSVFSNLHSSYFVSSSSKKKFKKIILNTKSKPCNIHDIDALKSIADFLSNYLKYLYNACIQSGVYPDNLKYGRVIPIFKSEDPDIVSNYITTLLSINKIFEKPTFARLSEFIS